jgi:hypothetical protein
MEAGYRLRSLQEVEPIVHAFDKTDLLQFYHQQQLLQQQLLQQQQQQQNRDESVSDVNAGVTKQVSDASIRQ